MYLSVKNMPPIVQRHLDVLKEMNGTRYTILDGLPDIRDDILCGYCTLLYKIVDDVYYELEDLYEIEPWACFIVYALRSMYENHGYPAVCFNDMLTMIIGLYIDRESYHKFFRQPEWLDYSIEVIMRQHVDKVLYNVQSKIRFHSNVKIGVEKSFIGDSSNNESDTEKLADIVYGNSNENDIDLLKSICDANLVADSFNE